MHAECRSAVQARPLCILGFKEDFKPTFFDTDKILYKAQFVTLCVSLINMFDFQAWKFAAFKTVCEFGRLMFFAESDSAPRAIRRFFSINEAPAARISFALKSSAHSTVDAAWGNIFLLKIHPGYLLSVRS